MRQALYSLSLLFALGAAASAATCGDGFLSSYIALGSAGCTIGNNTLFDFQALSGTGGSTEIAPAAIAIAPVGGTFNPGITVTVSETAAAGDSFEAMFTYRVSGLSYAGSSITLSGSTESPDGGVTDIQNFCAAGIFGPDGVNYCTGFTGSLLTLDGVQNQDSASFNAPGFVSLTDDLVISGGVAGSAAGGTVTDRLTAVPEPGSWMIIALGLLCAFVFQSRVRAATRSRNKGENA